jgi:hypothetical protein
MAGFWGVKGGDLEFLYHNYLYISLSNYIHTDSMSIICVVFDPKAFSILLPTSRFTCLNSHILELRLTKCSTRLGRIELDGVLSGCKIYPRPRCSLISSERNTSSMNSSHYCVGTGSSKDEFVGQGLKQKVFAIEEMLSQSIREETFFVRRPASESPAVDLHMGLYCLVSFAVLSSLVLRISSLGRNLLYQDSERL